jgi:hypothetical protein
MRLHYGSIPKDPGFDPLREGWRKLAFDPNPILLQVIAIPVAALLFVIWGMLFFLALTINGTVLQTVRVAIFPSGWLIILLLLIPVHELLHAWMHPEGGRSSNTILGLWLSRAVFYAHYEGVMSRNRFLLVMVAPYLILGLLPVALLWIPFWPPDAIRILTLVSLTGSLVACADIVGVGLIVFQIPLAAVVRNHGWETYWQLPPLSDPNSRK